MKHHFERAEHIYNERGLVELISTGITYLPREFNNAIFQLRHGKGARVMDEDWDTLILLDACRYDMFAERVPFDGELESRISLGSTSEEFLQQNFSDGKYHDTVYVNANAYLPRLGLDKDGTFHAVIDLLEDWDDELETAHPETVTQAALDANRQFPNKRLIIHYMQPHIPFTGEFGRELQKSIDYRSVWKPLRDDEATVRLDDVWRAYNENLTFVFNYVGELLEALDGRTVISADHGNLVGERSKPFLTRRMYGHPWGVYTPELVQVPWHVVESDNRREIRTDPPVQSSGQSEDVISDRLRALGYKD